MNGGGRNIEGREKREMEEEGKRGCVARDRNNGRKLLEGKSCKTMDLQDGNSWG